MRPKSTLLCTLLPLFVATSCQQDAQSLDMPEDLAVLQGLSFLGDSLYADPGAEALGTQGPLLDEATAERDRDSTTVESWIWVGRRQGYLQQYRQAIQTFSEAVERFPDDPRLYRHRGHRYLSVRDTRSGIEDLIQASELIGGLDDAIEPDGLPNARGIPTSTLHFNIWYHLGLAFFIEGNFERALEAYEECLAVSTNPDALVATTYWTYLTLMDLGRRAEAVQLLDSITADLDIIENHAYHNLLLLFKGERSIDEVVPSDAGSSAGAAVLFGVARWHQFEGREDEARETLGRILDMTDQWPAFGYIAAEAAVAAMPAR